MTWLLLMAILNICGFETGDAGECAQALQGTASIQSSVKRTGGYALRTNPTTTATGYAEIKGLAADGSPAGLNVATIHARFYFRYATKPASGSEDIAALYFAGGTIKAYLQLASDGKLTLSDKNGAAAGTSAAALSQDTWYRIELRIETQTSGTLTCLVDGVSVISGSGNTGGGNTDLVALGKRRNTNGQTVDFFYDDVSLSDSGYPGEGGVELMSPDGDGTYTGWSAGTYADVDEIPHDSDTSYVSENNTGVDGAAISFTLESAASAGVSGNMAVVKAFNVVRTTGTAEQTQVRVHSGSTDSDSSAYALTSTYTLLAKLYPNDPDTGVAWTVSGLNAAEVGVVAAIVPINPDSIRCTSAGFMVDFVAPTPTVGSETLTLTDSARVDLAVTESLTLTDTVANLIAVTEAIAFAESVGDRVLGPDETLQLSDTSGLDRGIVPDAEPLVFDEQWTIGIYGTQSLTISETAINVAPVAVTEQLGFDESGAISQGASTTETISFSESALIGPSPVTESISFADNTALTVASVGAESLVFTESIAAPAAAIAGTEAIAFSDAAGVWITTTDLITFSEAAALAAQIAGNELLTLSETAGVNASVSAAEILTLTDSAKVDIGTTDQISFSEATPTVTTGPSPSEQITFSDVTTITAAAIAATDALVLADALAGISQSVSESLTLTDAVSSPTVAVSAAESLTFPDAGVLSAASAVTDQGLVLGDQTLQAQNQVTESITFTETVSQAALFALSDLLTFTDATTLSAAIAGNELLTLTDATTGVIGLVASESIALSDVASLGVVVVPIELLTLSDGGTVPVSALNVSESITFLEVGTALDTNMRMLMVTAIRVRPALELDSLTIEPF